MKRSFGAIAARTMLCIAGAPALAQQGGAVIQSSPGQAKVTQVVEAVATVTALDAAKREVTLRDAKGREFPLVVGPEVRNLQQVKVGDKVVVQYAEALSLKLMKNGKELRGAKESSDAALSPAGARPAAVAAQEVQVTADVIAVNAGTRMVTLRGPKQTVEMRVNDPEQLKLIKVGDQINAVYQQALALSVQPAPAGK